MQQIWQPIINDFQPRGAVRKEDVDRYYIDRSKNDPTSSVLRLLKESIDSPDRCALLTGHTGSGKSSELIRLGEELANDFFVVRFDADLTLSPETTNHFDIILGMGIALFASAQQAGLNPKPRLADDLLKSLAKFIRKYEDRKDFKLDLSQLLKQVWAGVIKFGAIAVGDPVTSIVTGAFDASKLELKVGDEHIRTLELPPNRAEVIGALNGIIKWVDDNSGQQVIIITDGLDKVPAARARLLFAESSLLRDPNCALIYAAPIVFYHRAIAWQAVNIYGPYEILPNVPIQKRPIYGHNWRLERELFEPAFAVLHWVVEKRLSLHGKIVDDVITPESMRLLAKMSGGVMRELIARFNTAATYAKLLEREKIDSEIAEKVVMKHRQELKGRLTIAHRGVLQNVLKEGLLSGGQHESLEDELLQSNYLLGYRDESDFWFDAHPNVLPLL